MMPNKFQLAKQVIENGHPYKVAIDDGDDVTYGFRWGRFHLDMTRAGTITLTAQHMDMFEVVYTSCALVKSTNEPEACHIKTILNNLRNADGLRMWDTFFGKRAH